MEKKAITVQELINQLNNIENKNLPIDATIGVIGPFNLKEGDAVDIESIMYRTTVPSETKYAVSIVLGGTPKSIDVQPDGLKPVVVGKNLDKELFDKLSHKVSNKKIVIDLITELRRNALLAVADDVADDLEEFQDDEELTEEGDKKDA